MKLNYYVWSDKEQSITKSKQDNEMIDCIGAAYIKIGFELSWSIR